MCIPPPPPLQGQQQGTASQHASEQRPAQERRRRTPATAGAWGHAPGALFSDAPSPGAPSTPRPLVVSPAAAATARQLFPGLPLVYLRRAVQGTRHPVLPGSSQQQAVHSGSTNAHASEHATHSRHQVNSRPGTSRSSAFEPDLPDWSAPLPVKPATPLQLASSSLRPRPSLPAAVDDAQPQQQQQLLLQAPSGGGGDAGAASQAPPTPPLLLAGAGEWQIPHAPPAAAAAVATESGSELSVASCAKSIREQIQVDLQYLYCHIIREYSPAVAAVHQLACGAEPSAITVSLRTLPAALQVIVDAKCFVKNYGGPLRRPLLLRAAPLALPAPQPTHAPAPAPPPPLQAGPAAATDAPAATTSSPPHLPPPPPSLALDAALTSIPAADSAADVPAPASAAPAAPSEPQPHPDRPSEPQLPAPPCPPPPPPPLLSGEEGPGVPPAPPLQAVQPELDPGARPPTPDHAAAAAALPVAAPSAYSVPLIGPGPGGGGEPRPQAAVHEQVVAAASPPSPECQEDSDANEGEEEEQEGALGGGVDVGAGPAIRLQIQVVGLPDRWNVAASTGPSTRPLPATELCPVRALEPPPPEIIVVPLDARLADVRAAAGRALQYTYRMFRVPARGGRAEFQVSRIVGGLPEQAAALSEPELEASSIGSLGLEDGAQLQVEVVNYDTAARWRHAGGAEDWVVWCEACGTVDDDGERMVACDACGVWKHTRCCNIPDDDEEPEAFVCSSCVASRRPASRRLRGEAPDEVGPAAGGAAGGTGAAKKARTHAVFG